MTDLKSMALFPKKKKDDAPAAVDPPNGPADAGANDFSDFSDAALKGDADAPAAAPAKKRTLGRSGGGTKPAKAGKKALKGGAAVGLNIGNESIKVVELKGKGNDIAITAMGSMPTPPESISNGVIMSPGALTGAINDLFKQSGIKTKRVITSVSGTGSLIVRVIEVPRMDDKELSDNLQQDIDRYIPFPPSEVIMDHRALRELPSDPDAANMEVLLAAAQREVVDLHVRVLEDAKLDPQSIDVEPLAAARALTYNPAAGSDTIADYSDVSALVNIGATGTEISVLRGDVLVFTRTVPTGGNQLTQALADTLGFAFPDAESLKLEMADALPADTGGYSSAMYGATPYGNAEISGGYTGTEGIMQAPPVQTMAPAQTAPAPVAPTPTASTQDDWSEFEHEEPSQASTQAAAPVEDSNADPFDLDFFNQGPQDEPQEQNKQKDDPNAPNNNGDFDLSAFGLDPNLGNIPGEAHIYAEPEEGLDEAQLPAISDEGAWSGTPSMPTEAVAQESPALDAPTPSEASFDFSLHGAENAPAPTGQIFQFDAGEDPSLPFPGLPAIADETPEYSAEGDEYSTLPAMSEEDAVTTSAPLDYDFATPEDFEPSPPQFTPSGEGEYDFNYVGVEEDAFGALPTIGDTAVTSSDMPSAYDYSDMQTAGAESSTAGSSLVDDFDLDAITGPEVGVGASDISAADIDAGAIGAGTIGAGAAAAGAGLAASSADDFDADFGSDDFGAGFNDFGAGLGTDAGGITPQTVHGIVRPLLDELVGEVRRSLEYYASRYPDTVVRRITLVGGGARLSNLDALFTQSMGIPTTVGNPVTRLPLRAPALPPGYAEQHGPMYAVALGLALRDLA
jgi:type IV pilus assembly protein PilM